MINKKEVYAPIKSFGNLPLGLAVAYGYVTSVRECIEIHHRTFGGINSLFSENFLKRKENNDDIQDHYNPNDFNPLNFKEKEYAIRLKYLRNGGLALNGVKYMICIVMWNMFTLHKDMEELQDRVEILEAKVDDMQKK